jgi:PAS domain S-box-containing protein
MTALSENVLPETLLAEALEQLQQERATRQQLQAELERERSLRRCLVDSIPDLVFYKAEDGTYLGCNQAFAEFVGRSEPEIVGRTDAEIFAQSCAEAIQRRDRQVYVTGKAQRTEEWANFPNGDRRLLDTLKTPFRGAEGELLGLIGVCRDVSDRHRTETALFNRERYLAALVEIQHCLLLFHENNEEFYDQILEPLGQAASASRVYIFENYWDLSGRLMMSQCAEWCAEGIAPQIDNPALQNLPYDDFFLRWAVTLAEGEIINGKVADFPKSEQHFLVRQGIQAVLILPFIVDGDFFGFIGFDNCTEARAWDAAEIHLLRAAAAAISQALEHRQAESELQAAYAEQRALFNAMDDLVLVRDARGLCTKILTPRATSLLYRPADDMVGKTLHETFEPDVADSFLDLIRYALDTQETVKTEYTLQVEGNEVGLDASISPIDSGSVLWMIRDVTNRRKTQAEILQSLEKEKQLNELKSRFVSMVSHEIRTPLTTILTSADILQNLPCTETERDDLFALIQSSIRHMVQLLEDALFIGVTEAGKLEVNPTHFSLAAFCQKLQKETEMRLQPGQQLKVQWLGCEQVWLDEKLLWQLLSNLISNAIKYSPAGGTIRFDLACAEGQARFRVKDQGIGIPAGEIETLFECFHRASNVGTISGTGLGLAIVKSCVDRLQGEIAVESEVGVGTTFTVTLPIVTLPVKTAKSGVGE